MKKKITALLLILTMMCIPIPVKAEVTNESVITKKVLYQDAQYTIEVTTIIEQENISLYATTNTKTVSKIYEIKNFLNSTVASYTLKGKFSYDGTTATCTSATYSTTTDSILWSFESTTAYASGAKAIGNFTAKTLIPPQTISDTLTITCSKTGVIS